MTTKTNGSKDAARTPAPGTADPALTRAKNAARRVIAENIARIEEQERQAAAGPTAEPNPQREQGGPMQGPDGSPKADAPAKKAKGGKKAARGKKAGKSTKGANPAKAPKAAKPKRLSCIDAAALVIGKDPIGCKDMIAEMAQRGLWKSPHGQTPEASLYAAVIREISAKKGAARFKKVDRGLFVKNG